MAQAKRVEHEFVATQHATTTRCVVLRRSLFLNALLRASGYTEADRALRAPNSTPSQSVCAVELPYGNEAIASFGP